MIWRKRRGRLGAQIKLPVLDVAEGDLVGTRGMAPSTGSDQEKHTWTTRLAAQNASDGRAVQPLWTSPAKTEVASSGESAKTLGASPEPERVM